MSFARVVRTQQPQQPVGIDWGNPLTRALAFAWNAESPRIEVSKGIQADTNNTSRIASVKGVAAKSTAGQTNIEWNREFISTSNGAGTGDCTMVVIADPVNAGAEQHIFAQKNDAGGSPFNQVAMLANSNGGGGLSGAFCLLVYSASGGNAVAVSASANLDGNFHVWAGVRRGTNIFLYRDGRQIATASAAGGAITQSPARRTAIGSRGNGTTAGYDRSATFAASFNRALSDAEIKSLSDNPWQIFQPVNRPIFVPTSAVISISRPSADVTTTGWTGTPDNVTLFTNIDEVTASDTDYITSPAISGGENITFTITPSVAAGTWDVRYRAQFAGASAQVRIHLLDGSNVSQGVSSWQTVTSSFALYTASVTTTGTAVRVRIEVQ